MLIAGEAGIGKSRLVREVKAMAAELGFDVWQCNCFEQDCSLPFAPFVDLLRKNLTGLRDLSGLPQLLKLAPDLAAQFPDVQLAPVAEPEQEKRNLFRAWVSALIPNPAPIRREKGERVRVLILEDLHWCDDHSLEFLTQFARAISAQPMLVLLTYRNDEVTLSLSHFLAALERERLASEIELKRLTPDETSEVIRAIFDQKQVRDEFLDAIQTLTDGNPFFIEETLKSLVSSGDIYQEHGIWTRKPLSALRIPRTVQDAVQRRTAQLSEPARAVRLRSRGARRNPWP